MTRSTFIYVQLGRVVVSFRILVGYTTKVIDRLTRYQEGEIAVAPGASPAPALAFTAVLDCAIFNRDLQLFSLSYLEFPAKFSLRFAENSTHQQVIEAIQDSFVELVGWSTID